MKLFEFHAPIQLNLFEPVVLRSEFLRSDNSPRKAFYNIWLMDDKGKYSVKKESGAQGKILNSKEWFFKDDKEAESFFQKKIREKTNPDRKDRVYKKAA